jgi:hypothetical protein
VTGRDGDQLDIKKWISKNCQEHRSDIAANAGFALFKEMRAASSRRATSVRLTSSQVTLLGVE